MKRTSRVVRALPLLLVAMLLIPAPASGFHGYDFPIIHSGQTTGPFWIAYRVRTDGAGVVTHLHVKQPSIPAQVGALILRGNQTYFGITQSFIAGHDGAYVDVNVIPGQPVHFDMSEPNPDYPWAMSAMNQNGFGTQNPYVGELTFIWWVSGANKGVEFSLGAEPGVEMIGGTECEEPLQAPCTHGIGWETGTDTFVYASDDFGGSATAKAGKGIVSARANLQTSRSVTIDETFAGQFVGFGTHADHMTVRTPSGTVVDCTTAPCSFTSFNQSRAGPGTYTFNLTGAGGGPSLTNFGEVIVGGADLHLPA